MYKETQQLQADLEHLHQERQSKAPLSYAAAQRRLKPLELMVNLLEMAGYFEGGAFTQEGRRVVAKVVKVARARRRSGQAQRVTL